MDERLLIKFIEGETTRKESEDVVAWIEETPENTNRFSKLHNTWVFAGMDAPVPVNTEKQITRIIERINHKPALRMFKQAMKIAAVVLFAVTLGVAGYIAGNSYGEKVQYYTVISPKGERTNITLPDGSDVWLNSGSKLTYSSAFNRGNRELQLEGEAFFNVAKNRDLEFVVKTSDLEVTALGTIFNVMAYANERKVETTLEEGRVSIKTIHNRKAYMLTPGRKLTYYKDQKKVARVPVETYLYTSWVDGIYRFKDETFAEISRKLERMYDVAIAIENDELKHYRYTGDFSKNQSIEQVLEIIRVTTRFNYSIKERNVIIRK